MEELRIYGTDHNGNSTNNVLLTFECVDYSSHDPDFHNKEPYAVLHRVQLEPTADSMIMIDVPLDDDTVREHFEKLLSSHCHGYKVYSKEAAQ